MGGASGGRAIGVGHGLRLEMLVFVDAAHERGAVALPGGLPHLGGNVADRQADAPVARPVGRGAVKQQHMVQRGLARLELDIDGSALIDLDGDLLAAGEQVVPLGGLASSGNSSTS